MIIGIDASNIRAGGGISHLSQLLAAATPTDHGVDRVIVWACRATLECLPQRDWLEQVHEPLLDGPLPQRVYWQQVHLPSRVQASGCRVLFSPGATFLLCKPCATVAMSQLLVPPGDTSALVNAIEELIHDSMLRRRLIEGGLRTVRPILEADPGAQLRDLISTYSLRSKNKGLC